MVAYAGDRQPIYMPRFGFYVAPRPTNKQSIATIWYSVKRPQLHFSPSVPVAQLRSDTAILAYTVECRM